MCETLAEKNWFLVSPFKLVDFFLLIVIREWIWRRRWKLMRIKILELSSEFNFPSVDKEKSSKFTTTKTKRKFHWKSNDRQRDTSIMKEFLRSTENQRSTFSKRDKTRRKKKKFHARTGWVGVAEKIEAKKETKTKKKNFRLALFVRYFLRYDGQRRRRRWLDVRSLCLCLIWLVVLCLNVRNLLSTLRSAVYWWTFRI